MDKEGGATMLGALPNNRDMYKPRQRQTLVMTMCLLSQQPQNAYAVHTRACN